MLQLTFFNFGENIYTLATNLYITMVSITSFENNREIIDTDFSDIPTDK